MLLQFERLEERKLLAAGIDVEGGVLTVEGDGNANNIFVHGGGGYTSSASSVNGGGLIYAGLDRNGDGDFKDAGDVLKVYSTEEVNSLVILAKGGNDMVLVYLDGELGSDLTIDTGSGADTLQIKNSGVGRDLIVNTGGGDDQVDLFCSSVARDATITTAAGNDLVTIKSFEVQRNLAVDTGAGDDYVGICNLSAGGQVSASLGAGQDILSLNLGSLNVDLAKVTLDGGGGNQDRLLTTNNAPAFAQPDGGVKVKGFEIEETYGNLSTLTIAKLNLLDYRYCAAEKRLWKFHHDVDCLILPREV